MSQTERAWGDPHHSKSPILFLHGLPGIKTEQNQDLAALIHSDFNRDVLIQFGEGLGVRQGTFGFTSETNHKLELLNSLPSANITLVGHSWGGYQALVLAKELPSKITRLVLMSPLMGIMPRPEIKAILTQQQQDHPQVNYGDLDPLLKNAEDFNALYPIEKVVAQIPDSTRITILQAKDDPVTTPKKLKGLLPLFQKQPMLLELDCDHQFLVNRPLLIKALKDSLAN